VSLTESICRTKDLCKVGNVTTIARKTILVFLIDASGSYVGEKDGWGESGKVRSRISARNYHGRSHHGSFHTVDQGHPCCPTDKAQRTTRPFTNDTEGLEKTIGRNKCCCRSQCSLINRLAYEYVRTERIEIIVFDRRKGLSPFNREDKISRVREPEGKKSPLFSLAINVPRMFRSSRVYWRNNRLLLRREQNNGCVEIWSPDRPSRHTLWNAKRLERYPPGVHYESCCTPRCEPVAVMRAIHVDLSGIPDILNANNE